MGAWGAIIMSFFGAVFAALTMHWQWYVGGMMLAVPFLAFAAIGLIAAHVVRLPGSGTGASEKGKRVIMWSGIGEGICLFLVANILVNLHRADLLLPAMALVVGLHFLPIAFAAPYRPFYVLGGGLILLAAIGVALPPPLGGEIAGLGAALGLWLAAVLAVRRDWRSRQAAPVDA